MKQNKSRKQTLESAQYGLEIIFKAKSVDPKTYSPLSSNQVGKIILTVGQFA